jgi:hypothetical protein
MHRANNSRRTDTVYGAMDRKPHTIVDPTPDAALQPMSCPEVGIILDSPMFGMEESDFNRYLTHLRRCASCCEYLRLGILRRRAAAGDHTYPGQGRGYVNGQSDRRLDSPDGSRKWKKRGRERIRARGPWNLPR